ncbi:hypothetical protein Val02_56410 [Virgisporangium aliadipatigenens]|uniref:Uncharacterized protein n=1 Tax=Virgisporangium aliadipatigenens TaxID=741659 RepID=A0A8J3YRX1_9ACTN|nr:hypothetical protein [Virgisporangium aliadipatigenens]GIJ48755.1 hypothetical protein Val02_56410 [Virgisporangium aliadipatigenens]
MAALPDQPTELNLAGASGTEAVPSPAAAPITMTQQEQRPSLPTSAAIVRVDRVSEPNGLRFSCRLHVRGSYTGSEGTGISSVLSFLMFLAAVIASAWFGVEVVLPPGSSFAARIAVAVLFVGLVLGCSLPFVRSDHRS